MNIALYITAYLIISFIVSVAVGKCIRFGMGE